MSELEIRCFNGFEVYVNKQLVTHFYSQKTKALLIYLAIESTRTHNRSHLAGLLWPAYEENRARRNLSQTLTSLRKDLKDINKEDSFFQISTQNIGLNPTKNIFIDVNSFDLSLANIQKHTHSNLLTCADCTDQLRQITALYTGPFLNQFGDIDSAEFENWGLLIRERYLQQAIDAYTQFIDNLVSQNQLDEAVNATKQLLAMAPWRESAHRQLMQIFAYQGHRIQALNQYDVLTDVLMGELGVSPSTETDQLYDQILAGEVETPQNNTLETAPANASPYVQEAPFQAQPVSPYFVGRKEQLEHVKNLLINPSGPSQPVALVGMGGVGKTAFAAKKAWSLKSHFTDGVLWANSLTSHPNNILDSWARAFGNDFSGLTDLESKATAVRGMLANKRVLIVLDNVSNTADIKPLLPGSDSCAVLLTTRSSDVATALNAEIVQLKELTAENGKKLMIQILGEKRVKSSAEEQEAATQISELLHHLPLAVEIASQRLKSRPRMPLAAMAMRLEDTQHRLGLEISDQAVRSSFQVSWEGLNDSSQQMFRALSVFHGRPFTPEAAAHLTSLSQFDAEDELYILESLSLIKEEGVSQYIQHPLLADFGSEQTEKKQKMNYQEKMISYYLEFVQTNHSNYSAIDKESDNLFHVISLAHTLSLWENLLALVDGLTQAWTALGHYTQARKAFAFVDEAALQLKDKEVEAKNNLRWGEISLEQNDYKKANTVLSKSLSIFSSLNNDQGIADAKFQLARNSIYQNQLVDAGTFVQECQQYYLSINNQLGVANTLYLSGYLNLITGEIDEAHSLFESSLRIFKDLGDRNGEIDSLRMLAHQEVEKKNYDNAEKLALQAKQLSEISQEKALFVSILYLLTVIYIMQNKLELAFPIGEKCLDIAQKSGRRRTEALILRQLSLIHKEQGAYEKALQLAKKCSEIFMILKDERANLVALRQIGDISQLLNQIEETKAVWQKALQIAKQLQIENQIVALNNRLNNLN